MKIRAGLSIAAGAALAAAVLIVGCEDTELTAPIDGIITMGANPGTVVIDPNVGQTEGQSTITAQVFDVDGVPLNDIGVLFSTTGGALASRAGGSTTPVRTDGTGIATDTLTLTLNDPAEVTVSASSSSLTGSVVVKRSGVALNQDPLATISVDPPKPLPTAPDQGAQAVGRPVTFDGTPSLDPDGDAITLWRWTITASVQTDCATGATSGPPPVEVLEGPTVSGFDRIFTRAQELAVRLEVTDDPDAPADFANQRPVTYSALSDTISGYEIVCVLCKDNTAPTAVIAGPETIRTTAPSGQFITVFLDGTLSSDAETAIDDYVWTCGNGTLPTEIGNGARASCQYKVEGATATYTASLAVKDRGTGVIGPSGTFACQQISETDTVNVEVVPFM